MESLFGNATVMWNEQEIALREALVIEIPLILKKAWTSLNPAVRFERCETPILTPATELQGHIKEGFDLIGTATRGYLRPETTAGTFAAFHKNFPMEAQMKKRLPFCMWQVGKSFRDEQNPETMRASKLRLVEFYQMEFQLFSSPDTRADYIAAAANALVLRFGGMIEFPTELPHYSERTIDWMIDGLEVSGMSVRNDWSYGKVHEVAIGLDRLVAMILRDLK